MKLQIGNNHSIEIRKEEITANIAAGFSMIYLSDFHFTSRSQYMADLLIQHINHLNPDVILLGGDYVDSAKGLIWLRHLLKNISAKGNVYAIAGNHDRFFGLGRIMELMQDCNVIWLEDGSITINVNDTKIQLDGGKPSTQQNENGFNILFTHKPVDFKQHLHKYQLLFSGHLHGSQFVFWETSKGLYPGRLFYKWNILKAQATNSCYLISKGLGDTLPIRYNCQKDIIFVKVLPQDIFHNSKSTP